MPLRTVSLDELTIDDEAAFLAVPLYPPLKRALGRSGHRFLVPAPGTQASWDRALFLNLTFWGGGDAADVLCEDHLPADVVAHAAWHHVVGAQLARRAGPGAPTAPALLFAESIASGFDLYLVGRLLQTAPGSDFIATQLPIMSEAAQQAGLSETDFAALTAEISRDPERAFEDARTLLLDASLALLGCRDAVAAQAALERFDGHRFAPLLHHFQMSNWILYARAYAAAAPAAEAVVHEVDAAVRQAPVALDWLAENFVEEGVDGPRANE
jgi:hypothetical protein